MGRPGENGEAYLERNRHAEQNRMAERYQQPRQEMADFQHNAADQQQEQRRVSAYDVFRQSLIPLPPVPVAGGAVPQEEKVGYKERKRQKKQLEKRKERYEEMNSELKEKPRLLHEEEIREMGLLQTKEGRQQWADKKLSHSSLTREQTLKQVLNENDFSNFENLDIVMRNLVASRALIKFLREYQINNNSDPEAVCAQIQQSGEGVSALLNPALRLGLSLAQYTEGIAPELKEFCRALDEAMSTAVMVETLTHVADRNSVEAYFRGKNAEDAQGDAGKAIEANRGQQIQIAKRLLLMQLSDFQKITKVGDAAAGTPWDRSMAVALSHCSRVTLTLPRQDADASDAVHQERMWKAIMTTNGMNIAQDNSRASSTHSIERRKVDDAAAMGSKEKKVLFNFIGQRGMNCAIGGLGNVGISGKTLCNDGSCGHFYSMYKEADADHYGAMLMGLESDAAGVTNQMGHTHDIRATAEKASSLGGQRTDEIGEKYGGRQCDLSGMSAQDITVWMKALEDTMLRWQSQRGGMSSPEAKTVMRMLSGKKLNANGWTYLRYTLGVPASVAAGSLPH